MNPIPVNRLPQEEELLHIGLLEEELPYDFRQPHRHDYFECFVFREGGGTHYIDFRAHPITARSVHLVFPGQVHLVRRSGARGRVIVCRKEFMAALPRGLYTALFGQHFAAPCITFDGPDWDAVAATVSALQQELDAPDTLSPGLAESHMALLLGRCIRQSAAQTTPAAGDEKHLAGYRAFCALMEQTPPDARRPVSWYAAQLGMSAKALNNSIRDVTGTTCVQLLQDNVLTEAKRRLLYTGDSSKEIAYALGFRDCSYFTRFFRRLEGLTPGAFKAHWEEKYHA